MASNLGIGITIGATLGASVNSAFATLGSKIRNAQSAYNKAGKQARTIFNELERNFGKALKALAICGGKLRLERSFKDSWKDKYHKLQARYMVMQSGVKLAIDENNIDTKLAGKDD